MPIPVIPNGITTGTGSIFRTEVTQAIAGGARFVLPVGSHYVYTVGADCRLQIIDSAGAWNNITAAGGIPSGLLFSDGASIGFVNNAVGSQNIIYISCG